MQPRFETAGTTTKAKNIFLLDATAGTAHPHFFQSFKHMLMYK